MNLQNALKIKIVSSLKIVNFLKYIFINCDLVKLSLLNH